jgi:hypothetical protein
MKLKTYRVRNQKFKKESARIQNYIQAKIQELGVEIGYRAPKSMRIEFLSMNDLGEYNIPPYQRELQRGRLDNIADSVFMFGYDLSNPLVVTMPGMHLCDGNHRHLVTYMTLHPDQKVPVVIVEFESAAEEALYYKIKQNPPGGAPVAVERVKSGFLAKEPYSVTLYKLGLLDPNSHFAGYVGFRKNLPKKYLPTDQDILDRFSQRCPIPVGAFIRIFHWVGLEYRRLWEKRKEDYVNDLIQSMDYQDILDRMNFFAIWLFSWAGDELSSSKDLFRESVITGFLDFFITVAKQPHITDKKYMATLETSSEKFRKWAWYTTKLMSCKSGEALEIVLKKYNKGLSASRITPLENLSVIYGLKDLT